MRKTEISTQEMEGMRVVGGKKGTRRIGKVRRFVFHPSEKRVVGFIVKRPDLLWMFRRKDKFVSINGFDVVDGRIRIKDTPDATDAAARKSLGVKWDDCVLWIGMPILTEEGDALGVVGNVVFDRASGAIARIETDSGATANTLLGKRTIPREDIRGFKRGIGSSLAMTGSEGDEAGIVDIGAILVSQEARQADVEGGLAEKAGKASAVAKDKAGKAADVAKEKAGEVAKMTGDAVNKGAYATGKQIGKTKGMFSSFKDEYDKARSDAPPGKPKPAQGKKSDAKGMFSSFKDEFDKARRGDDEK